MYMIIFCCRTVIGLRGKDGVVFAIEKIITSKLYESGANKRIFNIDQHVGMAVSGIISDARQIAETARSEAASYKAQYGVGIPLKYLNERVSMYMHAYTLYSAVRPYGCSVLLSAYETDGPVLYMIDPSGVSYGYYGCAVGKWNVCSRKIETYRQKFIFCDHIVLGKAKQSAKTEIEKLKLPEMTCKDLVKEAARIIYLVHDELKDKQFELEMSWVGAHTNGRHERVPADLKTEAETKARQAMAEDSDSDTEDM